MVYAAGDTDVFQFLRPWAVNAPDKDMGVNQVGQLLGLGLNIVFGSAIAISLIASILSGIKFITAKGDPKAKAAAQSALTFSVLAFVLCIGAYTIKTVLFNVVGGDFGDLVNATPNF